MWLLAGLTIIGALLGIVAYRQNYSSNQVKVVTKAPSKKIAQPTTKVFKNRLLFMGDVMLARSIGDQILAGNNPFKYVQPTLDEYGVRIINLETTIAEPSVSRQAAGKLFTFNAPLESLTTLKNAHIEIASLANNHTRDFGPAATANMLDNLKKAGIKTAGAGKNITGAFQPLVVDIPVSTDNTQTIRLAIVALNSIENIYTNAGPNTAGSAYFDESLDAKAIKNARNIADIVVVFPHWGVEYQTLPSVYQTKWAHFFIDNGADIVIGSHPHVVEPTEKYKGKYVVYSLGNFIFDEMSGNSALGQMISLDISATVNFNADGSVNTRKVAVGIPKSIPTKIDNLGFPHIIQN